MRLTATLFALMLSSAAAQAQENPHGDLSLFQLSDNCIACHSNLTSEHGQDVSIGYNWRASMMANSARDPYWQAAVRREITDHPQAREAIEDKCSTCHMPMMRFEEFTRGNSGSVFDTLARPAGERELAMDGVSCTVCHQIEADNFGEQSSFTGGFIIDVNSPSNERKLFGPYDVDHGRSVIMQSAIDFAPTQSTHIQESELCATCHTLYTHSLDGAGNEVGELAEQVPYLEWLYSDYRESRSCQSCHMPQLEESAPISSVLGDNREEFSQHVFRGGNAFMLNILARHRDELGVRASREELEATAARTVEYLGSNSSRVLVSNTNLAGDQLDFDVEVENLAGHKLPTAYPSRRVWLHTRVLDNNGNVVFESGAVDAQGRIIGNDGDSSDSHYEPHYSLITEADQVQIYEPIMVDHEDQVTTGLLYGVRYIKDNRLLPNGFDKSTVPDDIAVFGAASSDSDFNGGGDRVSYRVSIDNGVGPFQVEVALRYQSIGYRWAENLREYDSFETNRFTDYYDEYGDESAITLAEASASSE